MKKWRQTEKKTTKINTKTKNINQQQQQQRSPTPTENKTIEWNERME